MAGEEREAEGEKVAGGRARLEYGMIAGMSWVLIAFIAWVALCVYMWRNGQKGDVVFSLAALPLGMLFISLFH